MTKEHHYLPYRDTSLMNKSTKYLVQNGLDETENIVEAHEIFGNETCLKFARTFDRLETDAIFVKKSRKCSSIA
uniref:ANK_REP_REGION domain-containing protein n=1 Tax=Strongyloides venezuelensis TaxID=75913 RepID=A0A0K0G6B4_STRVS